MLYDLNTSDHIEIYIRQQAYEDNVYEIGIFVDTLLITVVRVTSDLLKLVTQLRGDYPNAKVVIRALPPIRI